MSGTPEPSEPESGRPSLRERAAAVRAEAERVIRKKGGGPQPPVPDDQKLVHNETTKLVATTVNNVGTAFFVAGGVAPLVSIATSGMTGIQALSSLVWILTGGVLHYGARLVLRNLVP